MKAFLQCLGEINATFIRNDFYNRLKFCIFALDPNDASDSRTYVIVEAEMLDIPFDNLADRYVSLLIIWL